MEVSGLGSSNGIGDDAQIGGNRWKPFGQFLHIPNFYIARLCDSHTLSDVRAELVC
jgi:hypothetical protein